MVDVVAIGIVAGVAALAIVVARGGLSGARYIITVRGHGPEGIRIKGNIPGHHVGDVAAFVAELELPSGAKVWGIPEGDRIMLRFSDTVPEGVHQRLRNFLYLHH